MGCVLNASASARHQGEHAGFCACVRRCSSRCYHGTPTFVLGFLINRSTTLRAEAGAADDAAAATADEPNTDDAAEQPGVSHAMQRCHYVACIAYPIAAANTQPSMCAC